MGRHRIKLCFLLLVMLSVASAWANDPYKTLGLQRGASEAQIKRAYKKLAIKYHPDKNAGQNQEMAKEKFVQIQAAYEALTKKNQNHHQHHQKPQYQYYQQQHQQQYYYQYTTPQRESNGSILYLFAFLGLLAMFMWSQLSADDANLPEQPHTSYKKAAPAKKELKAVSASPFYSLAQVYAPHAQELNESLLQRKGRRILIFCIRNAPEFCGPLEQWTLMEKIATEFANDPLLITWCDMETASMKMQWHAFFDQQGQPQDRCFVVSVVNHSKCATFTANASLSYNELQSWVSKLVGGEVEQRYLAMDIPILAPNYI